MGVWVGGGGLRGGGYFNSMLKSKLQFLQNIKKKVIKTTPATKKQKKTKIDQKGTKKITQPRKKPKFSMKIENRPTYLDYEI